MNEFFEVCLGGLITIPAAFIFLGALDPSTLASSFALGFRALPNVFASMWGGQLFGFLWFLMLFVAAITSSVSMLQPVIAFLEEGFGLKRHASAALLGLITAMGCGFVMHFSEGLVALDTFDFWVGSVLIFLLALVQSILYGWVFGIERGQEEAHVGAHLRIPWFVQLLLKYVVPVYLLVIFAFFCWDNLLSKDKFLDLAPPELTEILRDEHLRDAERAERLKAFDWVGDSQVAQLGSDEHWEFRDSQGILKQAVRPNEENKLAVYDHAAGYVEKIGNNPAAVSSVLFILVVWAFLLLLIRIAGQRWEAEGRFANLDT